LELLENNLKSLSDQNELLKSEVKINRKILIIGVVIIVILVVINLFL
jgi:hypothetical protein